MTAPTPKLRILLVEDDRNLARGVSEALGREGYEVDGVETLEEARRALSSTAGSPVYSIILLDWMLPDGQGIDLLREIRSGDPLLPVLLLTARAEVIDKVVGLETGANDYLTKPFEPRELVARIRVQLRSRPVTGSVTAVSSPKLIRLHDFELDPRAREVRRNGKPVPLTKMEYELLALFAENPNRVFSREELLNRVWGYENFPTTRTVDTHILQLRQKFGETLFETVRGIGYRMKI